MFSLSPVIKAVLFKEMDIWCIFLHVTKVNLKAHHVEYNHFYIPDITSLVDIQEDYLKWFLSKADIVSPHSLLTHLLSICTVKLFFAQVLLASIYILNNRKGLFKISWCDFSCPLTLPS